MLNDTNTRELLDRTRRIETRLTTFLEASGFPTKTRRPAWSDGTIEVPSMMVPLRDLLAVIPADWSVEDAVKLMHGEKCVGWLMVPDPAEAA